MDINLTLGNSLALFGAMVVLASLPSLSVMIVVTRSATFGLRHGLATAAGIVLGDLVLMTIALLGLTVLAQSMEGLFRWVKLFGGAYLVWMGVRVWRARVATAEVQTVLRASLVSSLVAGLALTLGDQKAVLFYLAFFPAFMDLETLTGGDMAVIVAITVVAVGGAKCVYAALAGQVKTRMKPGMSRVLNRIAGGVMVMAGIAVALRA